MRTMSDDSVCTGFSSTLFISSVAIQYGLSYEKWAILALNENQVMWYGNSHDIITGKMQHQDKVEWSKITISSSPRVFLEPYNSTPLDKCLTALCHLPLCAYRKTLVRIPNRRDGNHWPPFAVRLWTCLHQLSQPLPVTHSSKPKVRVWYIIQSQCKGDLHNSIGRATCPKPE